ncbi:MAG: protein kinase [Bryobacteraceae bacterium]
MTPERWRQIDELYHAARENGAGILTDVASDLRQEVERLLAQDPDGKVLDQTLSQFFETCVQTVVVAVGSQLGPYRIQERLGAGGMGTVFRATDTRLNRPVAIKVVPEHFSARFEREARSISSLNHPHICTLYDVGPNYLVLELIAGGSLADRLKKGPLSMEQTIRYGIQMADALAAAHARGIVHRDLKPGNVMVPKSGIKVLDFGLALSAADETLTTSQMVVGTPAYMAPEQRQGGTADARTDIYALGLVLYEMSLGKRPAEHHALAMQVLPRDLAHIIDRCLAADPDGRWQAASDVRAELEWAGAAKPAGKAPSSKLHLAWIFAGVCASAAIAMGLWVMTKGNVAGSPAQFPFSLREVGDQMPVISPSGRYLAFAGQDENGKRWLFTRALSASRARALRGTENASAPMWSPDNEWVAFFSAGRLKKVRPLGGPVQTIADLPGFQEGTWGSKGDIVFRPSNREPLYLLRGSTGTPAPITRLDASLTENSHRSPQFLPDGRRFLYLARCAKRQNNALYLASIDSSERTRVMRIDANALYLPSAHGGVGTLLYYRDGTLVAQPFDTDGAHLAGEPKIVVEQIAFNAASTLAFFSAASDGRWLLVRPAGATYTHLQWFDRRGQLLETLPIEGELSQPRLSPAGDRVAFDRPDARDGNRDLWVAELTRGIVAPLTIDPANDWYPVWSPEGKEILFGSDRSRSATYIKKSMEPGAEEYPTNLPKDPYDWSSDGNWMAFGTNDILIASAKDFRSFRYLATPFHEGGPRFSPDTKWLAYSSDESGQSEIYLRPFNGGPGGAGKIQISTNGGVFPVWRRDGREVFFMSADNAINSVDLSNLRSTHTVPVPAKLFRACPQTMPSGTFESSAPYSYMFDTRDGNRFLVDCRVSAPGQFVVLFDSIVN